MALVLADRVRDTTTTTGTGTVTLSGTAPTGYQTFGATIGNGNTTYYTINAGSQWEVGIGTYSSTGPTLARTTVLASSNSGSLVDFSTGTKDVFVTYPAEEAVYQDGSSIKAGTAILGVPNGGTGVTTSTGTVAVVLSNSPTLVTPVLGAASATSIANALGAVGTPSYTFTGDTNTGIYSPAADTIAFVEGGVEAMRLDSSGNVGIGTSSPGNKLSVNGEASFGASIFTGTGVSTGDCKLELGSNRSDVGNAYIDFHAQAGQDYNARVLRTSGANGSFELFNAGSGVMLFGTNNIERMRIDSSGNLLVGTTSVSGKFTVDNTGASTPVIYGKSADQAGARIAISNTNGQTWHFVAGDVGVSNSGLSFYDATAAATRMRIDSSGNVGIGTTSPDVFGRSYTRTVGINSSGTSMLQINGTTYGGIDLGFNGTRTANILAETAGFYLQTVGAVPMVFTTNGSERARIDASGNFLWNRSSTGSETTTDGVTFFKNASGGGTVSYFTNGGTGSAVAIGVQADTNTLLFFRSGTQVGSVSVTTTATAYNTSSDYRLKDIDGPVANSGAYIDALKPVQGSWKADGSRFIGLLAHEVQEVSETPIATGEKDGEEMQAMDYSAPELIANLIAEIQSLRARVAQLEGN